MGVFKTLIGALNSDSNHPGLIPTYPQGAQGFPVLRNSFCLAMLQATV